MRNRIIAVILTAVMSISLAACGGKSTETAEETVQGEDKAVEAGEEISDSQINEVLSGESDSDELKLEVYHTTFQTEDTFIQTNEYSSNREPFPYGVVRMPQIYVADECRDKYSDLAEELELWSDDQWNLGYETLGEMWSVGNEMATEDFAFFVDSNYYYKDAEIMRADDNGISILFLMESFENGVHPSIWYESLFIDPKTAQGLPLSDVITDMFALPEAIFENLESVDGDYDFSDDYDEILPKIEESVANGWSAWTLDDEGLHMYFGAYDLMYYAFGPIFATLSYEDYPDLFVKEYLPTGNLSPIEKRVIYTEGETSIWAGDELLINSAEYLGEDEPEAYVVNCPDWDKLYVADGIHDNLTESLVILTEENKESSDWLNQDAWSLKNGIDLPASFYNSGDEYSDGRYWFSTHNMDETSLRLEVFDLESYSYVGVYDFSDFMNTPVAGNEFTTMAIPYATVVDDVLYVEIAHRTYSADQPYTGFIVAVDVFNGEVLWRSDMLVANGCNFVIDGDFIICGYGFTAEDDYLYILSAVSGAVFDKIKLKSAPDYFITDYSDPMNHILYLLTYNTAYTYKVTYG